MYVAINSNTGTIIAEGRMYQECSMRAFIVLPFDAGQVANYYITIKG